MHSDESTLVIYIWGLKYKQPPWSHQSAQIIYISMHGRKYSAEVAFVSPNVDDVIN